MNLSTHGVVFVHILCAPILNAYPAHLHIYPLYVDKDQLLIRTVSVVKSRSMTGVMNVGFECFKIILKRYFTFE